MRSRDERGFYSDSFLGSEIWRADVERVGCLEGTFLGLGVGFCVSEVVDEDFDFVEEVGILL